MWGKTQARSNRSFPLPFAFSPFGIILSVGKSPPFSRGEGFCSARVMGYQLSKRIPIASRSFSVVVSVKHPFGSTASHIHQSTLRTNFILHHLLSGCFDFQRTVDLSPVNKHNILYVCLVFKFQTEKISKKEQKKIRRGRKPRRRSEKKELSSYYQLDGLRIVVPGITSGSCEFARMEVESFLLKSIMPESFLER